MNSFTGIFQGFYLYFKNVVLSPSMPPHVLTQACPPQILKSPVPCFQHLWKTLQGYIVCSRKSISIVTECINDHNDTNNCNNCLNLKLDSHPPYVWRSSFLVKLRACSFIAGKFNKWTPSQVFFKDFTYILKMSF